MKKYVEFQWKMPHSKSGIRSGFGSPQNERSKEAIRIVQSVISIIEKLDPAFWMIENPRAMLRNMPFMDRFERRTVTYCQYGMRYQKPTDIWSNLGIRWISRPPCNKGAPCHENSPRSSKNTGIQAVPKSKRAIVPGPLCDEILDAIEGRQSQIQKLLQ